MAGITVMVAISMHNRQNKSQRNWQQKNITGTVQFQKRFNKQRFHNTQVTDIIITDKNCRYTNLALYINRYLLQYFVQHKAKQRQED